jgi:S-adenosylmethionine hydrolase
VTGPVISFLTDFGLRDPSAAIMHGVVLDIVPDARIVDISHEVRKYAIRDGALLLWCALPYLPVGFHVAVVDPGVGTARLPLAIATVRGDVLVGPDNGLLVAAANRLGGILAVHALEADAYRLPVVSSSFHGRDMFAPAAAHLARGVGIAELGRELDATALVPSPVPEAEVRDGELRSSAVYVDTFGNVKLAGLRADLEAALGPLRAGDPLSATIGERRIVTSWQTTFGDVAVGETLLYEDSYGRICLAASQASAAALHGIVEDLGVVIRRP